MTSRDTVPDVQIEPPETCEHEEWKSTDVIRFTSQTRDVDIKCDACRETGTASIQDFGTNEFGLVIGWDG